jgi:hyperosmotically inducible protein
MKTKFITTTFLISVLLTPLIGYTADSDLDRSHPKDYVKDSAITTKIKAKLAADSMASTIHISVDTDKDGVVWLSGDAKNQAEVDQAVSIAKATEGVKSVKNDIKIKKDM